MKTRLLWACLLLPALSFAQKIKISKGRVSVDGRPSFRYEKDGCGIGYGNCDYQVYDTAGNRVLRIVQKSRHVRVTPQNSSGTETYLEFIFLQSRQVAWVDDVTPWERRVVNYIAKNHLFVNGKLDEAAVDEFLLVHGEEAQRRY
ncbi:MAG: hypothetical protein EOO12_02005 [Chitinophagaceae bacterium]|nr:MAG: hypothetical protein EOO12_02005 [Chitinophagaceae bacterium]